MSDTPSASALPPQETTVWQTLAALQRAGYTEAMHVEGGGVHVPSEGVIRPATEFAVDAIYRFEGETDPADEAIVLALTNLRSGARGALVASYGVQASAEEGAALAQLLDRRERG